MGLKIPTIRPTPQSLIALRDIGAGANLKASRFVIPPNQMVALQNVYLVEDGSLIGRRGTVRWNTVSLGSGAILGSTRAYFTGDNHFLAAHAGTIYKGTDSTKTFASSLTGWDSTSAVWFHQYLSFVYASNAVDAPQKWDGSSWSAMGIAAPGSAPTAALGGAGTPNGTYTFKVTFVTATIESNGSAASNSVSPTNQQVALSAIPTGPAGTTKRRIYGFKVGVSSVYQLIGEINDNITTTFTVTTDQPTWTTAIPTTNTPPTTGAWLTTLFKNRLWKAGDPARPRRLYFSQVFVPEAWPATFYVDIPFSNNDEITGLFVLGDLLLVFGHNAVFYVIGDSPFSFVVKRSFSPAGCPSPWAIDRVENVVMFLSRNAVYAFDGATVRIISEPIDPQFTGVFQNFQSINYTTANLATLKYYDRLKAIVVSFPTGSSTTNDVTWWYFLRRQGWVRDSRSARMFVETSGKGDAGDLYAWDTTEGILRQWDPANIYQDDGANITARLKTGVHTGEHPLTTKVWRWVTIRARPANITLSVVAEVDQGSEIDTLTISLARGGRYGTGVYGTATYAADIDDFEEAFSAVLRGRGLALDISAGYSEFLQIAQVFISHLPTGTVRRRVGTSA